MVSGVHYRYSEGWEVCGGVGWEMATAYAEPSPNLRAHVMLCQVAAFFLFVPRIVTALCAEKSRPPSPDGVGDGA